MSNHTFHFQFWCLISNELKKYSVWMLLNLTKWSDVGDQWRKCLFQTKEKHISAKLTKVCQFFQLFEKIGIYGPSIQKHYQLIIFNKNFHVGFTEFMPVFIQIWTRGFGLIRSSLISRSVTWLTVIFRFLWVILWGLSEKKVWKNFWIFYKFSDLSRFPANVS